MSALLPCPFCGSPAELDDLGDPQDDSMVSCTNQRRCGVQQIARFNPESAAAAWNTRVPLGTPNSKNDEA